MLFAFVNIHIFFSAIENVINSVIYYFTALILLPKLINLSQKPIPSLLHKLKHMNGGFDHSKLEILIIKTKNV